MTEIPDDVNMVKEAVSTYVEGVVDFHFEKGESPWHRDGVKISYNDEEKKLHKRSILETRPDLDAAQIEQIRKEISQKGTIVSVDVTGVAASVKLVWDYERGDEKREITDYILLLKIENEWKIVGKVFNELVLDF